MWAVVFPVIVREFARWKVRNTAIERRDLIRNPVPLMPEFQRSVRLLGRRPTTQQFIDTIIKKYGTHILISATLGGKRGSLVSFAHFHAWLTVFTHCFKSFLHMVCVLLTCFVSMKLLYEKGWGGSSQKQSFLGCKYDLSQSFYATRFKYYNWSLKDIGM